MTDRASKRTECKVADGTKGVQGAERGMRETGSDRMPAIALIADDQAKAAIVREDLGMAADLTELRSIANLESALASGSPPFDAVILVQSTVDTECLNALGDLIAQTGVPVVVFADEDPNRLAPLAVRAGISSFVVDGLNAGRVQPIVDVAVERFRMIRALQQELEKSQERLAARKIVEQAKGLLMQHRNMTEQDAYKTLRDMAMRQGKPLKLIAENIISMSDLLP